MQTGTPNATLRHINKWLGRQQTPQADLDAVRAGGRAAKAGM
jgi:hypothetical protein